MSPAETGLYYLNSRYYDPALGRFLNADDVSFLGATGNTAGYNLYAYCENDPITQADSEGNNVAWMFAKLTSSKVYACTGSVSYSKVFCKYYAGKAWDLGIIKIFYYQKRYIFLGANIAKSAAGQW